MAESSVDLGGKRVFDGKGVVKDVPGAFGASRRAFRGRRRVRRQVKDNVILTL